MVDLGDLLILSLMITALALFWRFQGVRERAQQAAKRHCEQMGVQWLDGHVSLKSLRFQRSRRGWPQVRRTYDFEFSSTGEFRYTGQVVVLAGQVEQVQLAPHHVE